MAAAQISPLQEKVLRQVEYYFCDSSFCFDEFLQKTASEGAGGFVKLSLIAGFSKMKSLTTDMAVVVSALEHSKSVVMDEGKEGVKRKYPLPDVDPAAARTVHVAGFVAGSTEEVMKPVLAVHGEVESVRVLRNQTAENRALDGTAFFVFTTEEAAAAAVAHSPIIHTVFEGPFAGKLTLTVTSMSQWFEDLKKKRLGMKRRREGEEGGTAGTGTGSSNKKQKQSAEPPPMPDDYPRGVVIGVKGLGEGVDREVLKATCDEYGPVEWIEYERNAPEAFIRFLEPEHAMEAATGLKDKELAGNKCASTVLEGEDEKAFFKRKHDSAFYRRNATNKSRRGGRGRWRRGRGLRN